MLVYLFRQKFIQQKEMIYVPPYHRIRIKMFHVEHYMKRYIVRNVAIKATLC